MRRWAFLGALCLCAALLSGCGGLRNYMLNRIGDAEDMVRFDISLGAGTDMGCHAMVTRLIRFDAYSTDDIYRLGFSRRCLGVWKEDRDSWGFGPFGGMRYTLVKGHWVGSPLNALEDPAAFLTESADEIGLGAHLFFVGARVGVRPWQILDFALGFIGLDIAGDDLTWTQRQILRLGERRNNP